jgi:hypothetical protein
VIFRTDIAGRDRETVEELIDQMGQDSFPASDPPAWGVIDARLDRVPENAQPRGDDAAPEVQSVGWGE